MVRVAPCFALLALPLVLAAQDDLRDRIELQNGTEVRGRVLDPFATDEITLLQGGRRVRIERSTIAGTNLVGDRMRRFFEKRLSLRDSPKAQEFLIDQAVQDELPGLARLQALWVVLHDDEHEKAHRFLGHEKSKRGWLWPHEGKKLL
ncbi:MAG: hypothetical protein JNL12_07880, partial [Planctomycetes bacterium]|nr:hypothetical protein [Planctomycetota bacterium]